MSTLTSIMHNSKREILLPITEKQADTNKPNKKIERPNTNGTRPKTPKKPDISTKFFIKFDDNNKSTIPSRDKSNEKVKILSNLSEKFKNLNKKDPGNKSVVTNLLNWQLDDNSSLTNSKLSNKLNDLAYYHNIPHTSTLEENKLYYENDSNPSYASVHPLVIALVDLISKLNEHNLNSRQGIFYENKMKIVSFIYSNFQTHGSMSDALMLCPKQNQQNCFNIFKLLELLDNPQNLTSKIPEKSKLPSHDAESEVKNGIKPSISNISLKNSCLNIFGENFEENNKHLIDKELLNSILDDKEFAINNELINYSNGINKAPAITTEHLPEEFPQEASQNKSPIIEIIETHPISPEMIEHLNKLTTLIINVLLRTSFSSIKFINAELIRNDQTNDKLNISPFQLDIHISFLKSRKQKYLKEIKNILPPGISGDNFTELSHFDLELLPSGFYTELNKYLVGKLKKNSNFYDESLEIYDMIYLFYAKFCTVPDEDPFFMAELVEFKVVMFDLVCKLTLESSSNFRNIEAVFQPIVVYIECNQTRLAYPNMFAQIDPRSQKKHETELDFKVVSFTENDVNSENLPSEPFIEKKYIKQNYVKKYETLKKTFEYEREQISENLPPANYLSKNSLLLHNQSSQNEEVCSSLSKIPLPLGPPPPPMDYPATPRYNETLDSTHCELFTPKTVTSSTLDFIPTTPQFFFSPPVSKLLCTSSNGSFFKKGSYYQNESSTDFNNNNVSRLISENCSPNNSLINLIRQTMSTDQDKKKKKQQEKNVFQRIKVESTPVDSDKRSSVFSRLGQGGSSDSNKNYSRKRSSSYDRSDSETGKNNDERDLYEITQHHGFKKYRDGFNRPDNRNSGYRHFRETSLPKVNTHYLENGESDFSLRSSKEVQRPY